MKKGIYILTILVVITLVGCNIKPQPIAYGTDGCHFCSMTIVDTQHAAQIVTKKGKSFKFDAIECMVNYREEMNPENIALYLCNHYDTPEQLIDATKATFLISKGIPSPMGAYLTAFDSEASAKNAEAMHKGKHYNWEELLQHLNN